MVLSKRYTLGCRKRTFFKILEFFRCSRDQQESVANARILPCWQKPSPEMLAFVTR